MLEQLFNTTPFRKDVWTVILGKLHLIDSVYTKKMMWMSGLEVGVPLIDLGFSIGCDDLIEEEMSKGEVVDRKCLCMCSYHGHIEILKKYSGILTKNERFHVISSSSYSGHIDILEYVGIEDSFECCNCLDWAFRNSQIHVIEWILENEDELLTCNYVSDTLRNMIAICTVQGDNKTIDCIRKGFPNYTPLYEMGDMWTGKDLSNVNSETTKELPSYNQRFPRELCRSGNIDMIEYILSTEKTKMTKKAFVDDLYVPILKCLIDTCDTESLKRFCTEEYSDVKFPFLPHLELIELSSTVNRYLGDFDWVSKVGLLDENGLFPLFFPRHSNNMRSNLEKRLDDHYPWKRLDWEKLMYLYFRTTRELNIIGDGPVRLISCKYRMIPDKYVEDPNKCHYHTNSNKQCSRRKTKGNLCMQHHKMTHK